MKRYGLLPSLGQLLVSLSSTAIVFAADGTVTARVHTDPATGIQVVLSNRYSAPITAVLIETAEFQGDKLRRKLFRYFDTAINLGFDQPIAPGHTHTFTVVEPGILSRGRFEVNSAVSVVFSDGQTHGAAAGIAVLLGRRQQVRDDLHAVADVLPGLARERAGRADVVRTLTQWADRKVAVKPVSRDDAAVKIMGAFAPDIARKEIEATPDTCSNNCLQQRLERVATVYGNWSTQLNEHLQRSSTR